MKLNAQIQEINQFLAIKAAYVEEKGRLEKDVAKNANALIEETKGSKSLKHEIETLKTKADELEKTLSKTQQDLTSINAKHSTAVADKKKEADI